MWPFSQAITGTQWDLCTLPVFDQKLASIYYLPSLNPIAHPNPIPNVLHFLQFPFIL